MSATGVTVRSSTASTSNSLAVSTTGLPATITVRAARSMSTSATCTTHGPELPRAAERRVTAYYFYVVDEVFGPAFVKVCAYFPYPCKIWLNGHEYAKRAAHAAGIGFTELDNGFASTDDPAGLQRLCDGLGPGAIMLDHFRRGNCAEL